MDELICNVCPRNIFEAGFDFTFLKLHEIFTYALLKSRHK